jgi:8-hydroxy-5-deazaflavin:NADPH oxidoreductase
MRIGIIGAGKIGGTLAGHFVRVGHEVAVSNSRGPDTLRDVVVELGDRARAHDGRGGRPVRRGRVVSVPLRSLSGVADLIDQIGFDAVDAGTLAEGGRKHQPEAPSTRRVSAGGLRSGLAD